MGALARATGFWTNDEGRRVLRWALIVGLVVRLVVLWQTSALGTGIVDEQQYRQIAENVLAGHGFGWSAGELTSIRPPLFPGLLAAIWSAFGSQNLQAVRVCQVALSLATAGVVYLIGARAYGPAIGRYAAAASWLYPTLIFFNFLILTETLFTFLLLLFVLSCVMLVQTPRAWIAVACGLSLGLAALTRSVLWPLPLVLCPFLVAVIDVPLMRRVLLASLVLGGYAVVVVPWAVRNTHLQRVVTVVDTMGGINLRMGNYEHTLDDRMWDTVGLRGEQNWAYGIDRDLPNQTITEGQKEKWAQRKALEYVRTHPTNTARRALIKFADFWGLEREFIAGVQAGLFSPPRWFTGVGTLAMLLGYAVVVIAGAAGLWLVPPRDWRVHALLLLPVLVTVAAHTIVFGHSRYHLPLMPIFGLYGSALLFGSERPKHLTLSPAMAAAMVSVGILLVIWVRQIVIVDLDRITGVLKQIG